MQQLDHGLFYNAAFLYCSCKSTEESSPFKTSEVLAFPIIFALATAKIVGIIIWTTIRTKKIVFDLYNGDETIYLPTNSTDTADEATLFGELPSNTDPIN